MIASALSLVCFEEVVDDVFYDPLEGDFESRVFDQSITTWIQTFRTPKLTQIMTDMTALGSVSVIATLSVILISVVCMLRDFKGLTWLTVVLSGSGILPLLLKPMFGRDRPEASGRLVNVTDLSFPSGHSFGAAGVYIALAYYAGRYASTASQSFFFYFLGAVLISFVGLSRIYLGVHYPTDVLGGLSAGAAWGFFAAACHEFSFNDKGPGSSGP